MQQSKIKATTAKNPLCSAKPNHANTNINLSTLSSKSTIILTTTTTTTNTTTTTTTSITNNTTTSTQCSSNNNSWQNAEKTVQYPSIWNKNYYNANKNCNQGQSSSFNNIYNNRAYSFVDQFTEFVINDCCLNPLKPNTKVASKPLPAIDRHGNNNSNSNSRSSSSSSRSSSGGGGGGNTNANNNNSSDARNKCRSSSAVKNLTSAAISSSNVTTSSVISNGNPKVSSNNLTLPARTMQVLVKRRQAPIKTITTTTAATTTSLAPTTIIKNLNAGLLRASTSAARGILMQQQQSVPTAVIIKDEDDEVEEGDELPLSSTAQILRKFRIPKTTALLSKITDGVVTPPPTVGTPNSTTSSIGFLDEVIEEVDDDDDDGDDDDDNDNDDDDDDVIDDDDDVNDADNGNVLIDSVPVDNEVEETEYLDGRLLSSSIDLSSLENTTGIASNATAAPLQLQTLQPNGAITCINLPPNTILLSAADGTILATTAPAHNVHNSKLNAAEQLQTQTQPQPQQQQQQQLIALQDWQTAVAGGLSSGTANNSGATAMLLTADGTAIPIMQQSMAAAAAANEVLKAQVLA